LKRRRNVAGLFTGPWTAAAIAVVGALVGGAFGEHVGGGIGSQFDRGVPAGGGGGSW
jgi:hypothetical protein